MTSIILPLAGDVAQALAEGLRPLASLSTSRQKWADLVVALGGSVQGYLQRDVPPTDPWAAAEAIVHSACPAEEHPYPQRATLWEPTGSPVGFLTPGGVSVQVSQDGGTVLDVEFGRDSVRLAAEIMAALVFRGGQDGQAALALHVAASAAVLLGRIV